MVTMPFWGRGLGRPGSQPPGGGVGNFNGKYEDTHTRIQRETVPMTMDFFFHITLRSLDPSHNR